MKAVYFESLPKIEVLNMNAVNFLGCRLTTGLKSKTAHLLIIIKV
jgi:hypothetical protein